MGCKYQPAPVQKEKPRDVRSTKKIERWEGGSLNSSAPLATGPKTADTNMLTQRQGICKTCDAQNKPLVFF